MFIWLINNQIVTKGRVKNRSLQIRFSFSRAKDGQEFLLIEICIIMYAKILVRGSKFRRAVYMTRHIFRRLAKSNGMTVGTDLPESQS